MIEEITFKNIMSFKNETVLSFEATSDRAIESSHVVTMPNGTRLLRLAIVLGSNASGKSNLLYAFEQLHSFWTCNPTSIDSDTSIEPFMLDNMTPKEPSEFSLKIWIDGIRYWYQLQLTRKHVLLERLSYYKTTQPIMIVERKYEDGQSIIKTNPAVQKIDNDVLKMLSLNCFPNMSIFAARGRLNMKFEYVDTFRNWIYNSFMQTIYPETDLSRNAKRLLKENNDFKRYMLQFLSMADFNITGLSDHQNNVGIRELDFEHTVENHRGVEMYELNYGHQSNGTKRVIGIESAMFELSHNDSFLMIDEMDASLHPEIMEYILRQFLLDASKSQLLITTHYDGLLRTVNDLIRKDNIWFTEKDKSGTSQLYALVEFKGLSKIAHLDKAYRNGVFGALPQIKD